MNDFVREFFEDQPELLRRYERNEARYILQLPKNYDTISIDFGIDKNEMKRLVIALAELDLTIDEWLCFKMKELILADRLSKENRGDGKPDSRRQHLLPGDRGADGGGNDAADGAAVRGNAGRRQP